MPQELKFQNLIKEHFLHVCTAGTRSDFCFKDSGNLISSYFRRRESWEKQELCDVVRHVYTFVEHCWWQPCSFFFLFYINN